MEQLEVLLSHALTNLYDKNKDENYRRALKDVSFYLCRYLETHGLPLNKTPLTEGWLDSDIRKEYRREGIIK